MATVIDLNKATDFITDEGADAAVAAVTGFTPDQISAASTSVALGAAISLLSVPVTGALVASYTPRRPLAGAVLALGLSVGFGLLAAAVTAGTYVAQEG